MVVAVAVVAVLVYLSLGTGSDLQTSVFDVGRIPQAQIEIDGFHKLFVGFYVDRDRYPQSRFEIATLFGRNYEKPVPKVGTDPWGFPYRYLSIEREIASAGPDVTHGSADDIAQPYPPSYRLPSLIRGSWIELSGEGTDDEDIGPITLDVLAEFVDTYEAATSEDALFLAQLLRAFEDIFSLHEALIGFYDANDRFPESDQELEVLFLADLEMPFSEAGIDPWAMVYKFLSLEWEIHSAGPDKVFFTDDDLVVPYLSDVVPPMLNGGEGISYVSP